MSDWTPKVGDYVTTQLVYGLDNDRKRVEGRIKEIRSPDPQQLPIKVSGFWFEAHELTHRPDLDKP